MAGVTPALVSYYFPSKKSLVSAVVDPLLGKCVSVISAIIANGQEHRQRLHAIVALLIDLRVSEGHLIEHVERMHLADEVERAQLSLLSILYVDIRSFLVEGMEANAWRTTDPDELARLIWGMCGSVASARTDVIAPDKRNALSSMICDMISCRDYVAP